ncbi:hypothetical protein J3F84DRAFT_222750 [Trichoderma pleuroticola]
MESVEAPVNKTLALSHFLVSFFLTLSVSFAPLPADFFYSRYISSLVRFTDIWRSGPFVLFRLRFCNTLSSCSCFSVCVCFSSTGLFYLVDSTIVLIREHVKRALASNSLAQKNILSFSLGIHIHWKWEGEGAFGGWPR